MKPGLALKFVDFWKVYLIYDQTNLEIGKFRIEFFAYIRFDWKLLL